MLRPRMDDWVYTMHSHRFCVGHWERQFQRRCRSPHILPQLIRAPALCLEVFEVGISFHRCIGMDVPRFHKPRK
jgi:hypothetical protein